MAFKTRSRNDIITDILQASFDPTLKTKIMFKAYLSYGQLKDYLGVLEKNDLLQYSTSTQTYVTTAKGYRFLETYGSLDQLGGLTNIN